MRPTPTLLAPRPFTPRSLLFVPGHRADLIAKVVRAQPDAAVVDLEDAVPNGAKDGARETTVAAVASLDPDGTAVLVRVNPPGSPWFAADLAAMAGSAAHGVVLPKYSSREDLALVRSSLPPDALVVVGIETVAGVAGCRELLVGGPEVADAVYFGAEDYIADIGGRRTEAGEEVLFARSEVMLAARLADVGAIDQAVVEIRDDRRFLADARRGRDIGYTGKICVHPGQVALSHEVFTPTEAESTHARAVLDAARDGAAVLDEQMIDEVHVRTARRVLARTRVDDRTTRRG